MAWSITSFPFLFLVFCNVDILDFLGLQYPTFQSSLFSITWRLKTGYDHPNIRISACSRLKFACACPKLFIICLLVQKKILIEEFYNLIGWEIMVHILKVGSIFFCPEIWRNRPITIQRQYKTNGSISRKTLDRMILTSLTY